ncbi:MAG: hypothetical protein ACJAQS_001850 [Porticoccus sp.]|jgi:uncharacterized protein YqcC (DUF446 family)
MAHDYAALTVCLIGIEEELRRLNQWQAETPSAEALASTQPFCVDTLSFSQWVQFVFMPLLNTLIEKRALLPIKSQISPMAEEHCKIEALDGHRLVAFFQQLDALLTQ